VRSGWSPLAPPRLDALPNRVHVLVVLVGDAGYLLARLALIDRGRQRKRLLGFVDGEFEQIDLLPECAARIVGA